MPLKTFAATHLNKHAQEVFAAAKDDGSVVIEHSNYYGGVFAIVWNPQQSEEEVLLQLSDGTIIDINSGDGDVMIADGPAIDKMFDKIESDFSVFASGDLIGDKE